MIDFNFYLPTKIYFGKGKEKDVGKYIKELGYKKILFHYGKNSIKKSGLYNVVINSLKDEGIDYVELGGVEANPSIELVKEGVKLCKNENVDFILAVGGGSVIDSSKSIGHGYFYDGDPFDFNQHRVTPLKSLPIGVILTIAAAGSEMSNSCVISNLDTMQKKGFNSETNRPVFVIENPELTFSVDLLQTGYGVIDMMSHTIERYFNQSSDIEFADYLAEGLLKSIIDASMIVTKELDNYDARATLMVASSYSHNGLTGIGKKFSFPIHQLEHEVSALRRDIAHGAGLACLIPAWLRVMKKHDKEKLKKFCLNVFNISPLLSDEEIFEKGIEKFESIVTSFNVPLHLRKYGMNENDVDIMLTKLNLPVNGKVILDKAIAKEIYLLAL